MIYALILFICYLIITLCFIVSEVITYLRESKKAKQTGAILYWNLPSQIGQILLWPLVLVWIGFLLCYMAIELIKDKK